jgi:ATPase family associated with various cellular activities (AAA)
MNENFNLNYSLSMGMDASDPDHAYYVLNPGNRMQPSSIKVEGPIFPQDALDALDAAGIKYTTLHTKHDEHLTSFSIGVKAAGVWLVVSTCESYRDLGPFEEYNGRQPSSNAADGINILYGRSTGTAATSTAAYEEAVKISEVLKGRKLRKKTSNSISILCANDHGMYTKTLEMPSDYSNIELNLHYGTGFKEYHEKLIAKMKSTSKGIVLLHGDPGTGKSYYIRHLISQLTNKLILYVPNAMISGLATPAFNDFIIDWIDTQNSNVDDPAKKVTSVLLVLEDAEKSLIRRDINAYSDEVSTILNASDGIMNDFMSIQVLATFNVDISMIDSAVMRKRRAISIKSFGKLSADDARKLAEHIGADPAKVKGEMSLADIYQESEPDSDSVLFPEMPTEKGKMGFGK